MTSAFLQLGGVLAFVIAMTFFILVRPQLKRQQSHSNFLQSLVLGDRIITRGGLIGEITQFERGNLVHIRLSETTNVVAMRSSIEERFVGGHDLY